MGIFLLPIKINVGVEDPMVVGAVLVSTEHLDILLQVSLSHMQSPLASHQSYACILTVTPGLVPMGVYSNKKSL